MEASVRPDIPELPLTDSARSSGSAGRKSSASRGRRRKITLDQVEAELCQRLIDSGDKLTKTDEHLAKLLARKLTFPEDNSVGVADRNAHAGDGKLDTDYKLKEAEGLIAILQDELTAAKRAQTEVAEEARHWREETENLKCALRDIRRDNERLTAERDHAICQQYETRKVLEDQRKAEDIGYRDLLTTHERTLTNHQQACMELERTKSENRRLIDDLVKCKMQLASFREKRDNADLSEATVSEDPAGVELRSRRHTAADKKPPLTARTWGAVKKALGQYKPPAHRTPSPPPAGVSRYPSDPFHSDKIFRDDSGVDD